MDGIFMSFEDQTKLMSVHLSAAIEALEHAQAIAPDDWDTAHIEEIRNQLEGLVVEVNEGRA